MSRYFISSCDEDKLALSTVEINNETRVLAKVFEQDVKVLECTGF